MDRIGKRKEKKRIEKAHASLAKTRKLEHARVIFGLERRTKLTVFAQPRRFVSQRHYLRKLGYVVPRGSMTAFWNEGTRRSADYESRTRSHPQYVPFKFEPEKEPTLFEGTPQILHP